MTLLSLPMLTVRKGEDTILTYINPDRPLDLETPPSLLVSCPGELRARLAVALFSGPLGSSRATERRHLAQNESWCRTRRFGDSGPLHGRPTISRDVLLFRRRVSSVGVSTSSTSDHNTIAGRSNETYPTVRCTTREKSTHRRLFAVICQLMRLLEDGGVVSLNAVRSQRTAVATT